MTRLQPLPVFCLLLSVLTAACQASPPPPPAHAEAPAPANATALRQQLVQAIGSPRCQQDSQCRAVAIGHKACGGPEGYLVWSEATAAPERIAALAAQYTAARRAEVTRSGMVSDCKMQLPPAARCSAQGLCVAQEGLQPPSE